MGASVTPAGGKRRERPPGPFRLDMMTTAKGALFLEQECAGDEGQVSEVQKG